MRLGVWSCVLDIFLQRVILEVIPCACRQYDDSRTEASEDGAGFLGRLALRWGEKQDQHSS